MRKMILSAGLALATVTAGMTVAPVAAQAQNGCERAKSSDRTTGTVLGGVVGALAGGALGGNATGALVGAGVGAVGGNVIAGRRAGPCPEGYYRRSDSRYGDTRYRDDRRNDERRSDDRRGYQQPSAYYGNNNGGYGNNNSNGGYGNSNRCGWQEQAYRDAYGNVVHRQVQVCR